MEESSFNSRMVEEIILEDCEENDTDDAFEKFPYELLKVPSSMPITGGIDVTRREVIFSAFFHLKVADNARVNKPHCI